MYYISTSNYSVTHISLANYSLSNKMSSTKQDPVHGSEADGNGVTLRGHAWREIVEVSMALTQQLDRELRRRAGMDIQTYDVLLHLTEADAQQRMSDLATAVVLSKSGFTALADRIEREGLIQRQPDPADRRVTRVRLTPEGVARFRAASNHHREIVHEIFFSAVTEEEAGVIVAALRRVRAGFAERGFGPA